MQQGFTMTGTVWTPEDRAAVEDIYDYCVQNGIGLAIQGVGQFPGAKKLYLNFFNTGNLEAFDKLFKYVEGKFNA